MQTQLPADFLATKEGKTADRILRSCVHCGFCTATCPTYQLLGDELDSPRGRIYLIKQLLENQPVSHLSQLHLDRCLTCRACETTCPSGVEYTRLLEIGRSQLQKRLKPTWLRRGKRYLLRRLLPYRRIYGVLMDIARPFKFLLPKQYKHYIPAAMRVQPWRESSHSRQVLILEGCVQAVSTPETNLQAVEVLDKLGIAVLRPQKTGCCGALSHHLDAIAEAQAFMRQNIDAWSPYLDQVEAIISSASGCGLELKDYAKMLADDPAYQARAAQVSALAKDLSEVIAKETLPGSLQQHKAVKVAFHSPCTLQHGQKITGLVEKILQDAGYQVLPVQDAHLCCGSAGTYSLLQAKLAAQLRDNKLSALNAHKPDIVVSANIGCQLHLSSTDQPVKHWISLLAELDQATKVE